MPDILPTKKPEQCARRQHGNANFCDLLSLIALGLAEMEQSAKTKLATSRNRLRTSQADIVCCCAGRTFWFAPFGGKACEALAERSGLLRYWLSEASPRALVELYAPLRS